MENICLCICVRGSVMFNVFLQPKAHNPSDPQDCEDYRILLLLLVIHASTLIRMFLVSTLEGWPPSLLLNLLANNSHAR